MGHAERHPREKAREKSDPNGAPVELSTCCHIFKVLGRFIPTGSATRGENRDCGLETWRKEESSAAFS